MNERWMRCVARFWKQVDMGKECWEWTGCLNSNGYGSISVPDKPSPVMAHRFSYEMANGLIPLGMFVCHHCDNPKCVRPSHLFLGDQRANLADAKAKGRPLGRPLRTVCPQGHSVTGDNVYISTDGYAKCRACNVAHHARYRELAKR